VGRAKFASDRIEAKIACFERYSEHAAGSAQERFRTRIRPSSAGWV
jgi:hypothetical protein